MSKRQTPSDRRSMLPLMLLTLAVSLAIIVVGGAAIYLFFDRLGDLSLEEQRRRIAATLPEAVRPPSRAQLLVLVSTDGQSLTPRLEELRGEGIPRTEQLTLIIDKVLRAMAEERGTALPFTLRAVQEAGDTVVIDLIPEQGAAGMDFRGETLLAYALVNSVVDNFSGVEAVQFLIDGQTSETLAGSLDITAPLVPNAALRRSN